MNEHLRLLPDEAALADLEDFFENATVGLHIVSGDGRILKANWAELQMLGYSPDEYIGQPIGDFHVDQPVIEDILTRLGRGEKLTAYPARLLGRGRLSPARSHYFKWSNLQWRIDSDPLFHDGCHRGRSRRAALPAGARCHAGRRLYDRC